MASMRKNLNSVLIKPAGPDCNMSCPYCFYVGKRRMFPEAGVHRMSEEVLEETIRQVLKRGRRSLSFSWQGGEPTLMGLAFFEKAVRLQMEFGRGHEVGNGLQTNGLLIDRRWADFLREFRFLVGLSLDGPQHVHDRYRRLPDGRGSWSLVVDRARLLLDAGVDVNALTVVNDYSVQFPEEIYQFLKVLGLCHMQFIPCVELDPQDANRSARFSVSPLKYGEFLTRLFDMWLADFVGGQPTAPVRYFDSLFYLYAGLAPPECTLLRECGDYLVVEHSGDVYSCDFFVEPAWRLGQVMEDDLEFLLNSRRQREFGRMKAILLPECQECRWLHLCRGGCTKDRRHNPGNSERNYLCPAYKLFFQHADSRLREMAQEWKRQKGREHAEKRREKVGRNDS